MEKALLKGEFDVAQYEDSIAFLMKLDCAVTLNYSNVVGKKYICA